MNLTLLTSPSSPRAQAFRDVRAAVQLARQRVIVVTTPKGETGSAELAANLAASLAQSGRQTLLIDGTGDLSEFIGQGEGAGLINALAGQPVSPVVTAVRDLAYIPLGQGEGHPGEGLMRTGWEHILGDFESVVVHAPPLLIEATAVWLAVQLSAGVVLAVRRGESKRADIAVARAKLAGHDAVLLGAVYLH
ncbi:MAG: hypothetical protein QNJ45_20575 [Ardenticatenaceae bacterium]|nr:hypothetical protein [Ardenticatenaceae bacterium]